MNYRREYAREGWIIRVAGRSWDDWVYPSEEAAAATISACSVQNAVVEFGILPGIMLSNGGQAAVRLIADRKWRGRD